VLLRHQVKVVEVVMHTVAIMALGQRVTVAVVLFLAALELQTVEVVVVTVVLVDLVSSLSDILTQFDTL